MALGGTPRPRRALPFATLVGFVAAIVALLGLTLVRYLTERQSAASAQAVTQTVATIDQLQAMLSALRDAETGQRGFLLTGDPSYLAPYNDAVGSVPANLAAAERLFAADGVQRLRFEQLAQFVLQSSAQHTCFEFTLPRATSSP